MYKLLTILLLLSFTAKAEDFYVSTSGSSGNSGSFASPWDLRTALRHPAAVDPGDNIWIRGGTYTDTITAFLTGTSLNPIKVRNYNNERVIIDGSLAGQTITRIMALNIYGAYTWYWGLEVTNSDPDRTGSFAGTDGRGDAMQVFGVGIKVINCILYDCGEGISTWEQAIGSEYYGNVIFNNGWIDIANGNGTGHGVYTQNNTGIKSFKDNIVLNNYGYGLHAYTQGSHIRNFYLEGNVCFNDQWLFGGSQPLENIELVSNFTYKNLVQLGYVDKGNDGLILTNNYFANAVQLLWWKNVTATGNTIFAYKTQSIPFGRPVEILYESATSGPPNLNGAPLNFNFNNNTYYRDATADEEDFFFYWTNTQLSQGAAMFLPEWQAEGQDATIHFETFASGLVLTGKRTFVRQNTYDPNRAHIVIYNWDQSDSAKVGVAGFLSSGNTYELHNASDYFNDVVTGTFAGGDSLSVPMTGHTVAEPVGTDTTLGENTFPEFGTFVLIKTSATPSGCNCITTVADRGQSGVIRTKQDRGLPNSIKTRSYLATEQAASYVYNASGQPNGSYGANTLDPNFDNAAGAKSSGYVLANTDNTFTLEGKVESRDQEITTDAQRGNIYLRMTASGKAYVLRMIPAQNHITIGITNTGLTEASDGQPVYLYINDNTTALIPGFGSGQITFGVSGFDVYVKHNGVEYIRFKSRVHIVKGKAGIKIHDTGLTTFTINHFARKTLYSNTDAKIFNCLDFGMKQGNTTGSITGGTNTLTVASLNGLAVGDHIIVAVGGEATFNGRAGGMRGTKGIGDAWPSLSYANTTAMQADHSKATNLRAWVEDSGDTYYYTGSVWNPVSVPNMVGAYANQTLYYDGKALPKALKATITNISGLVLTLSKNASVSATSANVYFDNNFILSKLLQSPLEYHYGSITDYPVTFAGYVTDISSVDDQTGVTVQIPAGTYAVGERIYWGRSGVTLKGAGADNTILFSPDGATSFDLQVTANNIIAEDFQCVGNAGLNGFGSLWDITYVGQPGSHELSQSEPFKYPQGVLFTTCDNVIARNCKIKDVFLCAFGTDFGSTNVYRYNITMEMTDPQQMYLGWLFQDASSSNNVFEECHFTSPYICKAFESFNSLGTQFINCTSVNGLMSFNNAGLFLVDNFHQTFTGNNKPASVHVNEPCINVNTNFGANNSFNGEIRDLEIVFENYVDDRNDLLYGIQVTTPSAGVGLLISGGTYTGPNWLTPADVGPQGIRSEGPNVTVDGFTVNGLQLSGYGINRTNIYVLHGTVKNCVANYAHVGSDVTLGSGADANTFGTVVVLP